MGKADDMRRQRELRYEQDQREDAARRKAATASAAAPPASAKAAPVEKKSAPAAPVAEAEAEVAEAEAATEAPKTKLGRAPRKPAAGTAAAADRGTCSVCLKPRPLKNGLVASHQKGFGKVCTGSRKPPT